MLSLEIEGDVLSLSIGCRADAGGWGGMRKGCVWKRVRHIILHGGRGVNATMIEMPYIKLKHGVASLAAFGSQASSSA